MTILEAFQIALQRHQSGRLADAEALCRQILAAQPDHADALCLLGVIARRVGRHDLTADLIRRAIAANPTGLHYHMELGNALLAQGHLEDAIAAFQRMLELDPNSVEARYNLANALQSRGHLDEAIAAYRAALQLRPDLAPAHNNLGVALKAKGRLDEALASYGKALEIQPNDAGALNNLGMALQETGRLDESIAVCQRAIQIKPDLAEAWHNLGIALQSKGQLDESIDAYRRALQIMPNYAKAFVNLATVLKNQGRFDEAVAAGRRACELDPGCAGAHNNLGAALAGLGRFEDAVASYRRALQLNADLSEAYNNLGHALRERGELDEAVAAGRRAIELRPGNPDAHNNLGASLASQGRLDEAMAAYRRALEFNPGHPEALNNLGNALREPGRLDEAIASFHCALQHKPDYPEAHNNLGNALKDLGRLDEAIAAYRRATQIKPGHASAHSNLIYALHFHPDHDATTIAAEQRRWNRQFSEPLKRFIRPHANDPAVARRLRIGYVSPDFRDHVVGRFMLPLFERHDHRQFEIFCYSGVARPDKFTDNFRRRAHHWRSTLGVGDEALAEIIRQDGIDILVDLTQHMAGNRLAMFARKPAPVQVSFAGYPESAGVEAIEYRISDRYLEAASANDADGRKEHLCLLDSFWCYDPCGMELEVNPVPALETGTVTFGCLNNFCKVNDLTLSLWARVLGRVKDSRLVISGPAGRHRQRTLEALEKEGIESHRVEFVARRPLREYLELHHRLDIVLDTFPYNGGVTTCDALWMGTPVVSLAGHKPVSRAGLSLLSNLGLPELVARTEAEYIHIAESLASDLPRLAELRSTLRDRMKNSLVMDAPHFTRQTEQAYREMWQRGERMKDEGGARDRPSTFNLQPSYFPHDDPSGISNRPSEPPSRAAGGS